VTAKKPVERRQSGSRTPDVGCVVALPPSEPSSKYPKPHWSREVREAWDELWVSPLGGEIRATDLPALRRLFELRHLQAEAMAAMSAEPMVIGSTGQPVLSPFAAEVHRLEAAIAKLEDRFGLTPLARLRLGVTLEEGKSLASRNAALLAEWKAGSNG
jgi:Phage terminase, small subunit